MEEGLTWKKGKYNWKFTYLVLMLILSISFTSAALDITQTISDKKESNFGYGKIELKDWFGLGETIWTGEIKEHTTSCSSNCESLLELNVKEGLPYYDSIKFYKTNNGQRVEKNIYSYKVEMRTKHELVKVPVYDWVCNPTGELEKNGTAIVKCENIETGTRDTYIDEFSVIDDKTLSDGNTAYVKISGNKEPTDIIDWVITTNGESLESWAVWGSGGSYERLEYFADATNDNYVVTSTRNGGQQFTAGTKSDGNKTLTLVRINLKRAGAIGIINLSLYAVDGSGFPTGAILSSNLSINGDSFDTNYRWENITMSDYAMTNGTKYALIFGRSQSANAISFATNNTGNYVGGNCLDNSAGWVNCGGVTTQDVLFEVWVGNAGVNLNTPVDNFTTTNSLVSFNCTASPTQPATLVNISLWTNNTGWKLNATNVVTGVTNTTTFTKSFPLGNYNWSCSACDSDGDCGRATENRTFSIVPTTINSVSYNASTYETLSETYSVNASGLLSSADLVFNGTSYTATVSGDTATKSLVIPTSIGNKSFYWSLNGGALSSSTYNQNVLPINLTLCNYGGLMNVTYMNFTFKDEEADTYITASADQAYFTKYYIGDGTYYKTFLFTNTTVNKNYAFCFSPSHPTLNVVLDTFQYSNTTYPQRQYYYSGTYTNATTQKVLYLLGSADGIYSSFQIVNSAITPVSGATVTIERQFAGVWTVIGTSSSDSAGLVTFWVNPNYDHRISVSKSGFVSTQVTIKPTQSLYTITLGGGSSAAYYNTSLEGIYYFKSPASGVIAPGTYDFTFNVTAQRANMIGCVLNLTNRTSGVLMTGTGTGTGNCLASISYAGVAGQDLYGKYYVQLDDGLFYLLEGDGNWKFITITPSSWSLKSLIQFLSESSAWAGTTDTETEEYRRYEFTKIVSFFLIFALILAAMNVMFNYDITNPGVALWGLSPIILICSIAGGRTGKGLFYIAGATPWVWLDNYILAIFSGLISLAIIFTVYRRESG